MREAAPVANVAIGLFLGSLIFTVFAALTPQMWWL